MGIDPIKIADYITEDPDIFIINEGLDTGGHPTTNKFWQNIRSGGHRYSTHPLMAMYGTETANKAYDYSEERLNKIFPEFNNLPHRQKMQRVPMAVFQIWSTINKIERKHVKELEQLAIDIVSQVIGVPKDILRPMLTDQLSREDLDLEDDEEGEEEISKDEVDKRITFNAMMHGSSVHNMMTIHHAVKDRIEKISPQLMQLYDKISSGSEHTYWLLDMAEVMSMAGGAPAGVSFVSYDQQDTPMVVAKAVCFPVLVQELIKGTMELLSMHGLQHLSRGQLKSLYKQADKLEDEPYLIQIGPHLWRSFLKVVPKDSKLANVVARLATKEPQFVHNLLSELIENIHNNQDPANVRKALEELVAEVEEETDIDGDYL